MGHEVPRQLGLFGVPPPEPERGIGPASDEEHRAVAVALPAELRLGTSSWSFPGWAGIVYDRDATPTTLARRGLGAYARHCLLRAVGIDRTFYGPVPAATFAGYAADVPEDFRFLVKASGECTTPWRRGASGRPEGASERYLDATYAAGEVVAPFVEGLGGRAGPLVFQFPPQGERARSRPERFAERLATFLAALPRGPWYAVELRDRELYGPTYLSALRDAGATHCFNVHPGMPPLAEQRRIAGEPRGPLVARWMLHGTLQYEDALERYQPFTRLVDEDPGSRAALASLAAEHTLAGWPVVIVANNKAEGSAPLSVFKLAREIAGRCGHAPAERP